MSNTTTPESMIRVTFAKEMNSVINSFENLSSETKKLRDETQSLRNETKRLKSEKNGLDNYIIEQKKVDKAVSIVNVLTLIALYELTKKAFNKWIW